MIVNDIPIAGRFIVTECGKILHKFTDRENESGDIPPDIATREVIYVCTENGYLNIAVW